ncbi:MAG TPA: UDP-2,3-diacylglucosamine diphosphatase [Methylophilaceae bacterium]|nr:UDP-2,3-diacylglucosamine diphosphatase [Methylophilaceae bacterium]
MNERYSLFISDLHLCRTRPAITHAFLGFLQAAAGRAEALYILGDLFEYWAGDDDLEDASHRGIIAGLSALQKAGTRLFFMHGNRDFLLGENFAKAAGAILLSDPTPLTLYGKRVLLTHGDELCTDDTDYQAFRQQVRNPAWQSTFLAQPLSARKAQIEALRQRSEQEKSHKAASIMDVNAEAVHALLRQYGYPELLIHGHTHRPARHEIEVDGHRCERWVLGDWYEQGSYLRLDTQGLSSQPA